MIISTKTLKETYIVQRRLQVKKDVWTTWMDIAAGFYTPEAAQAAAEQLETRADGEFRVVRRQDTLVTTA